MHIACHLVRDHSVGGGGAGLVESGPRPRSYLHKPALACERVIRGRLRKPPPAPIQRAGKLARCLVQTCISFEQICVCLAETKLKQRSRIEVLQIIKNFRGKLRPSPIDAQERCTISRARRLIVLCLYHLLGDVPRHDRRALFRSIRRIFSRLAAVRHRWHRRSCRHSCRLRK
jgi:hypothetical protein